jgi:hypothetical protein
MRLAQCSPIIMAGALVFPPVMLGMIDASATRSPSTPRTRGSGSTNARSSVPIRQVPTAWSTEVARFGSSAASAARPPKPGPGFSSWLTWPAIGSLAIVSRISSIPSSCRRLSSGSVR